MTTRIAILLFILIVLAILLDTLVLETGVTLETLKNGINLLQTLAFWR